MRRSAPAALAALALLAAAPTAALADNASLYRDCQDGRIDAKYSQKEFSDALRSIPTDVDEYTDCRDVISRARLGAAGRKSGGKNNGTAAGGGAGADGGAAPPPSSAAANAGKSAAEILGTATPAEQAAVTKAVEQSGSAPVQVGDEAVSPDSAGLSPAGAANVVPTPLVVALVLLGLGIAAGGAQTIRSRVLARRTPGA